MVVTVSRYSRTSAQVMVRWSLQRNFICIPKSSKKERIQENFDVFNFRIADGDMQALVSLACTCVVTNILVLLFSRTK